MLGSEGIVHHLERTSRVGRVDKRARSPPNRQQPPARSAARSRSAVRSAWDSSSARSTCPSAASWPARELAAPVAQQAALGSGCAARMNLRPKATGMDGPQKRGSKIKGNGTHVPLARCLHIGFGGTRPFARVPRKR